MDYIQSGLWGGTGTQNLAYQWDKVGNLTQRQDNNQGLTENFYYDNLYRLDYSQLNGTTNLDMQYQANGNIDYKSDAGWYWYNATKVHAVEGTTYGKSFSYDNNGNMTWSSDNGSITFYANNLPKFAYKDANNSSHFHYGPDRNRWRHTYRANGTDFNAIYVESLFEKVSDSGSGKVTFKNYIRAGGVMVAMKARDSWGGDSTTYLHGDHLGSISNYTDGSGTSLVSASYGAFGDRRGSNWTGSPTSGELTTMNNLTRRGFTEHEMLDSSALVHMNGRAYSSSAGRFVSADPYFDCGLGTQGWNRYSYVGNRALSATDPTGFFSWDYCDPSQGIYDIFQCFYGRFGGGFYLNFGPVIDLNRTPATDEPRRTAEECAELEKLACRKVGFPVYTTTTEEQMYREDEDYDTWIGLYQGGTSSVGSGPDVGVGSGRLPRPTLGIAFDINLQFAVYQDQTYTQITRRRTYGSVTHEWSCDRVPGCPDIPLRYQTTELIDTGWAVSSKEYVDQTVMLSGPYNLGIPLPGFPLFRF